MIDISKFRGLKKEQCSTLYVSGYWVLPENRKWDVQHYLQTLEGTAQMMRGGALVFFFEDPWVAEVVSRLGSKYAIEVRLERMTLEELPGQGFAKQFVKCCSDMKLESLPRLSGARCGGEEKALVHYWRDFKGSGPQLYEILLSIWLSKVHLVSQVTAQEPARYDVYAWADASVSQFERKRSNWNFAEALIQKEKINHYGSLMTYFGRRLPLNASFLCGSKGAWAELERCYLAQLRKAAGVPYAHDEETVLGLCVTVDEGLFNRIGEPFQSTPLGTRLERAMSRLVGRGRPGATP